MNQVSLALDVGGTKIAYGLVADDDPLTAYAVGSIPSQPADSSTAAQIAAAIRTVSESGSIARVGVGCPGVVKTPEGVVTYAGPTMPGWMGTDIRQVVRECIDAPIAVHNDVRTWAYGEHRLGAGQEFTTGRVLYISLGTGVGGAIVENGQLIDGPTGTAGEVSEIVTSDFRGRADRVENIGSGTSLARYYNRLSENPELDRIEWESPRETDVKLPEIIERLHQGDELAQRIVEGNLYGLGRALGAIVSAFDISAIVLGGGVSHIGELVSEPIARGVAEAALIPNRTIPIRTCTSMSHAPLLGAAALARDYAS